MKRKTEVVRSLVRSGELKQALKIAKDFRLGISKPDSDAMKLAYECMVHERFYKQLGYNLSEKVAEGMEVLKRLYGRSEENDLHQQVQ